MKMKEVTEKTKLTERAVRLYIENGLITPSFNESYSGRRNINFYPEDVETLKRISVLRKAGFSISQIKVMQSEPERCKEVLEIFLDKTKHRIETDTETVSCIEPLLLREKLDLEQISQSLDKSVVKEKELPAEDSEIPLKQKIIRKIFLSVGVVGFSVSFICFLFLLRVEIRDIKEYLYPKYDMWNILFVLIVLASLILPAFVIFINRKNKICSCKKTVMKTVLSLILLCLYFFCGFYSGILALISGYSNPESFVVSHTRNAKNYMLFDDDGAARAMSEFLPDKLPEKANLKYEYYYKEHGVSHQPPLTRVFVEIPLDKMGFHETVEHYKNFLPSDSTCEPWEERENGWTVIYYREKNARAPTNYTPIFAYNDKENKVRFICEYGDIYLKGAHNNIDIYEW